MLVKLSNQGLYGWKNMVRNFFVFLSQDGKAVLSGDVNWAVLNYSTVHQRAGSQLLPIVWFPLGPIYCSTKPTLKFCVEFFILGLTFEKFQNLFKWGVELCQGSSSMRNKCTRFWFGLGCEAGLFYVLFLKIGIIWAFVTTFGSFHLSEFFLVTESRNSSHEQPKLIYMSEFCGFTCC